MKNLNKIFVILMMLVLLVQVVYAQDCVEDPDAPGCEEQQQQEDLTPEEQFAEDFKDICNGCEGTKNSDGSYSITSGTLTGDTSGKEISISRGNVVLGPSFSGSVAVTSSEITTPNGKFTGSGACEGTVCVVTEGSFESSDGGKVEGGKFTLSDSGLEIESGTIS